MNELPDALANLLDGLRHGPLVSQVVATVALLAAIYGVHRVLRYYIRKLVTRPETRAKYWAYSRTLWMLLAATLVGAVWLEELKTVALVLAGVLAGILISGKEVFLGFLGRTALAVADHYKIGDRIRINGVCGDVINIGLLYTWLLEVDFDHVEQQATGRVVLVPHLWLTQYPVINATLGHAYVWDELDFAFPLAVDGAQVIALLTESATAFLHAEIAAAEREVPLLGQNYAAKSPPVTPIAYTHVEAPGGGHQYQVVSLRYTIHARARRAMHSALTVHLLGVLGARGIPLYQAYPYAVPADSSRDDDA